MAIITGTLCKKYKITKIKTIQTENHSQSKVDKTLKVKSKRV